MKTKETWEVLWADDNKKFYTCHTSLNEDEANAFFEVFSKLKKNVYVQHVVETKEIVKKHGDFDEDNMWSIA